MGKLRGGDIRDCSWGGRHFTVAPECAIEIIPGGTDVEWKPSGNGEVNGTGKSVAAGVDGLELIAKNEKGDIEYLTNAKNNGDVKPLILDLIDGTTWQGSMGIEGEMKYKSDTGTVGLAFRGEKMEQI